MKPEEREAIAFVEAFQLQWPALANCLIHVANEGGNRGLHPGYHQKRARMGVRKGVADYLLATRHNEDGGLWIELKAPGGTLKAEQLEFLTGMASHGYSAAVAWGWQGAMVACRRYLTLDGWCGVNGFDGRTEQPIEAFTLAGKLRTRGKAPA